MKFMRWYGTILACWIALECAIFAASLFLLHLSSDKLLLIGMLWLTPPVLGMPLIYYSSFVGGPKLRALVFSLGALVFFVLVLNAMWHSWPSVGPTSYEIKKYLVPSGIVGSLFSAACVYLISVRKLGRQR